MKNKRFNILAITVSIVALGIIGFVNYSKEKQNPSKKQEVKSSNIIPPLKGVNVDYVNFKVNAQQPTALKYSSGSKISIPENAFLDKNNKPVTGLVDLKYREFHTPAEIFISGIPMNYDSAGINYQFESAGMLEIVAFQNNEQVFANPASKITVEMASKQIDDKYNIYQYDSIAGKWNFKYKDSAGVSTSQSAITSTSKFNPFLSVDSEIKSDSILKPVLANSNNFHFNIDVSVKDYPELAIYNGIEFEVDDQHDSVKMLTNYSWSDVHFAPSTKSDIYSITVSNGFDTYSFDARPVLNNKNYIAAMAKYNEILSERKRKELVLQKKNDSIRSVFLTEQALQADFYNTKEKYAMQKLNTQFVIQRTFILSGFGIWNSDCPAKLPQGEQFAATYVDSLGKVLTFNTLFLVERGRNAMFSIAGYSRLYYDPKKENLLWAVTNDNKIALFREKKFKNIKIKDDKATLEMEIIDKQITKAYEVKSIIDI